MFKFYLFIWLRWAFWLTVLSVSMAIIFSIIGSFGIYLFQGMPALDKDVIDALWNVFWFLSSPMWSFVLFIVLFIRLKYIFNKCAANYQFKLMACEDRKSVV